MSTENTEVKIERGQEWHMGLNVGYRVITVSDVVDGYVMYWWLDEGSFCSSHRNAEWFLEYYKLVKNADGTVPAVPNDNEYRSQDIWFMGGRPRAFTQPFSSTRLEYRDPWFPVWSNFDKATHGSPDDVLMYRDGKVVR